jgi:hypothetical protein
VHHPPEFAQFHLFTSHCVLFIYSANSIVHTDPLQTGILEEDEKDEGMSKSSFMQHGKVLSVQHKRDVYVKLKNQKAVLPPFLIVVLLVYQKNCIKMYIPLHYYFNTLTLSFQCPI